MSMMRCLGVCGLLLGSMGFTEQAHAGATGNTFSGEVVLETFDGSLVPFDWLITFNSNGTLNLNASGSEQTGTFREPIDIGFLSLYTAQLDTEFESRFTGITLLSNVNILISFSDNAGNTLDSGRLTVVPARKARR